MTSVLFALIFLSVLLIINLIRVEYTFFILFTLHLLSGLIVEKYGLAIAGVSATGLANFLTLGMLVINLPGLLKMGDRLQHKLLLYSCLLFLFYAIPLFYNFDFNSFTRFISRFGSFISIYYLAQLSFHKIDNFERFFILFLKYFFVFTSVAGLWHALSIGFNIDYARSNNFSFFFFEYPHSFSIFATSLLPAYFFYIFNKKINPYHYLILFFFTPLAFLYSGAKIGMIVYITTLAATVMFTFRKKLSNYIYSYLILSACIFIFIKTPVYEELLDVLSVPLDSYIFNTADYSINSLHTRIKVWTYMLFHLMQEDNLVLGFGWRSWSLQYLSLSGAASSQSDYFTVLFELGLLGLAGFVLFRILVMYCFFKEGKISAISYYMGIGCLCSLFVGGLTESIEGYPSTSWLIPFFLALSHFYSQQGMAQKTPDAISAPAHEKGQVKSLSP